MTTEETILDLARNTNLPFEEIGRRVHMTADQARKIVNDYSERKLMNLFHEWDAMTKEERARLRPGILETLEKYSNT
jgi:hypothetical protein